MVDRHYQHLRSLQKASPAQRDKARELMQAINSAGRNVQYSGESCDLCSAPLSVRNKTGRCRTCQRHPRHQ